MGRHRKQAQTELVLLLTWPFGSFLICDLTEPLFLVCAVGGRERRSGPATLHWALAVDAQPQIQPPPPRSLSPSSVACPVLWASMQWCCAVCTFWCLLVWHLISFLFTFPCSCRVHKRIGSAFFSRWLILTQEFHGWASRGLWMFWIFFCGKRNLTEGVRESGPWVGDCATPPPCPCTWGWVRCKLWAAFWPLDLRCICPSVCTGIPRAHCRVSAHVWVYNLAESSYFLL